MSDVSALPVCQFTESRTTRLISTAYINEPALSPLADDDSDLAFLEDLEGLTSSRRGLPEFIPEGVHPDELVNEHYGYGWTYVNAAFCYTRSTGNRFSTAERGAWYATCGINQVEAAQAEVAWHLSRELAATGIFENITAYRELLASFATSLHDLAALKAEPMFDSDPDIGYPAGQRLASTLLQSNSNGILYPSVRHAGGTCLAAFRPHLVQNVRQGNVWEFRWDGSPEPSIERV